MEINELRYTSSDTNVGGNGPNVTSYTLDVGNPARFLSDMDDMNMANKTFLLVPTGVAEASNCKVKTAHHRPRDKN